MGLGHCSCMSRDWVAVISGNAFFFQAEDGIRDHCVTGVQTCALPILLRQAQYDNDWLVGSFYNFCVGGFFNHGDKLFC